jgi:hypothetical protein
LPNKEGEGAEDLREALDVDGFGLPQNLAIGLVPFNILKSLVGFCLYRIGCGFRFLT